MRVLLTGGTGFVGQAIGDQLRRQGHALTVLARNPHANRARQALQRWQARTLVGDVTQDGPWIGQLKGVEAAIHTVGIISECRTSTFERIHVQGTQRLVSALRQNNIGKLVHISALGTRPNAISRYHRTKWQAEECVRQSGLEFTILRPSLIYGAQDQFINLFARMSRFSPILPVIGSGQGKLQPISVESVALCAVAALTEPKANGQTIDLCGPKAMTFLVLLREMLAVLNRKRWLLRLPLPIARPMASFMEWFFPAWLQQPPPLNRDQIIMLQEDNASDPTPAQTLFGFQEAPFEAGIRKFLATPSGL